MIYLGGGTIGTDVQTKYMAVEAIDPNDRIEVVIAEHSNGKVYTFNNCNASRCIYNIEHFSSGDYTVSVSLSSGYSFFGAFYKK